MGEGQMPRAGKEPLPISLDILDKVRERAWAKGMRWIILKDLSEAMVPSIFPALTSSTFFSLPGLPNARLGLSWSSFEEYARGGTFNARRNIRKRLRNFSSCANLRIEVLDSSDGMVADMMPLYGRVMARAKVELERLTPGFFTSLSAAPDIDKKFVVCFDGDQLIGWILCLFAGKGAVCLRGGLIMRCPANPGVTSFSSTNAFAWRS